MSARCPTCGRSGPRFDPFAAVVAGETTDREAPVLCRAWRAVRAALVLLPPGAWVARTRLIDAACVIDDRVNRSTAEQLLRAAERAGLIDAELRRGGDPERNRVYLRVLA